MLLQHGIDLRLDVCQLRLICGVEHGCSDALAHLVEVLFGKPTAGGGGAAHTDTASNERAALLVGDGVLVHRQADAFQELLGIR